MGAICGFSGVDDKNLIKSMFSASHKKSERTDFYVDDYISLAVGGSEDEANIAANEDMLIAFLGQIHNFEDLTQMFQNKGDSNFKNDSELVLELFCQKKNDAFNLLRGSFVCAIWDFQTKTLTLVRDHFGQCSLYYGLTNDNLFFSSDMKSLLLVDELKSSIDLESIKNYLVNGYVPPPKTFFLKISKMFAGSTREFSSGKFKNSSSFWNLETPPIFSSENLAIDCVYNKLLEIVDMGVKKHSKCAIFLSGGFDSSLLSSLIRKISSQSINAYTFVNLNERNYSAELIADFLGLNYKPISISSNEAIKALSILPTIYCDLISDPFVSLPTYILSKAAQNEPAIFAADNSDNVFWGLTMLYNHFNLIRELQFVPEKLRRLFLKINKHIPTKYPFHRAFYNMIMASVCDQPYKYVGRIFTDQEAKKLIQYVTPGSIDGDCSEVSVNENLSLGDFYAYNLATAAYRTTNIARIGPICNSFSLKLFEPFLDPSLVQLGQRIPLSLKQPSKTKGKLILKKISEKYNLLPTDFYPQKKGLSCPLDTWYTGDFKEWVHQTILEGLPGFINKGYVKSLLSRKGFVDRFYNGLENYRTSTRDVFSLLMLILWIKEYAPEIELNSFT